MRRILLVSLLAGLVLAPAAVAKGPNAVLTSGHDPIVPGVPWEATVELNEFRDTPTPLLIAIAEDGHVDAKVRKVAASMDGAVAFKTTMVFPTAGRWKLMLVAGRRRFNFPVLGVGTGEEPKDYFAFPAGSETARVSGRSGGELTTGAQRLDASGGGSGVPVWLFPILGIVLAGVGAAAVTRRGSR